MKAKLEIVVNAGTKNEKILETRELVRNLSGYIYESKSKTYPIKTFDGVAQKIAESIAMSPPSKEYINSTVRVVLESATKKYYTGKGESKRFY